MAAKSRSFLVRKRCEPEELYELQSDPEELRNLASEPRQAEKLVELRTALTAELKRTAAPLEMLPAH
jgi:hypothetical protein